MYSFVEPYIEKTAAFSPMSTEGLSVLQMIPVRHSCAIS
jgi:hypothetical protein